MTRLAMLGRADSRGLAAQSESAAHHLLPDKVLVIDMHEFSPYPCDPSRFDGLNYRVGHFQAFTDEDIDWLLTDIDVLLSHETFYDDRIILEARRRGVRTVVQYNHELATWLGGDGPRPDEFIAPALWRIAEFEERMGVKVTYLPSPVDTERLPYRQRTQARRFLHVAGHPAASDRAGTEILLRALPSIREQVTLTIRSQGHASRLFRRRNRNGNVQLELIDENRPDYWTAYETPDVLIAPRRYGGQSLPVNEALCSGMPVIALDREPERSILPPESLVPSRAAKQIRTYAGIIDVDSCAPADLARRIDVFARDDELVTRLSKLAGEWRDEHSWEALLPAWNRVLGRV